MGEGSRLEALSACASNVVGIETAAAQLGDFAPGEDPAGLPYLPQLGTRSMRCLQALAELTPEALLTARFHAGEEPLHVTTPHKLAFTVVSHALSASADGQTPRHDAATRPPPTFWRPRPRPVLEILVPDNELEEGVPWGIQLLFRPVPGLPLRWSLENLKTNLSEQGFDFAKITYVIQYNKRDLPNAAPLDEMQRLLNPSGAPEYEACATVGDGVFETLKGVAKGVLSDLKKLR